MLWTRRPRTPRPSAGSESFASCGPLGRSYSSSAGVWCLVSAMPMRTNALGAFQQPVQAGCTGNITVKGLQVHTYREFQLVCTHTELL